MVFIMNEHDLKKYLAAQIEEINKYKWIESEKRDCDIGFQSAAFEWISKYSESFRTHWCSKYHYFVNYEDEEDDDFDGY